MYVSFVCRVCGVDSGLCDEPITLSEESYRVYVCVCVCMCMCVCMYVCVCV